MPPGWAVATLPALVCADGLFVDGDWVESKDQDPSGEVRLIQLADVGDGRYTSKSNRFLTTASATNLDCTFLNPGDVLIARMPDPLGRACVFPGDSKRAVTVVDVAVFRSGKKGIDHRWLVHAINATQTRAMIETLASGTTRSRISRGNLATVKFPVPPLNEQSRIVEKLDAIFEQTRAARARLERLPGLLEKLKRSILAAAFRGDLTKDWRAAHPDVEPASVLLDRIRTERRHRWESALRAKGKDPSEAIYDELVAVDGADMPALPKGWVWGSLDQLSLAISYGHTASADYDCIGPRFLRITDIDKRGQVEWASVPRCLCDQVDKYAVLDGDIVVASNRCDDGQELLGVRHVRANSLRLVSDQARDARCRYGPPR